MKAAARIQTESTPQRVFFERCIREPKQWKEEIFEAARAIANRTRRHIWVCFSGGLQSEILCRAFFDQGIDFSVLTVAHQHDANSFDVAHASRWCRNRDIEQRVIHFDTSQFFTSDIDAHIEDGFVSTNAFHYFKIALLTTIEKLNGFAVIGEGMPAFRSEQGRKEVLLDFNAGEIAVGQWIERHDADHEPFFFRSTPELWASYLRIPIVSYASEYPHLFRNLQNKHIFKRFVSFAEWPDIRERPFYSPFGTFRKMRLEKEVVLKARFGNKARSLSVPVQEAVRSLVCTPGEVDRV